MSIISSTYFHLYDPVDEYCVNPIFHTKNENAMNTSVVIGANPYQNGTSTLPNRY